MTSPSSSPSSTPRPGRSLQFRRQTHETDISIELSLDRGGASSIDTGIPFLDHMLTALAKHGGLTLSLQAKGDLEVDDHHTAEDCAIVLGSALDRILGDRAGIARFGYAYAPLDESLARAVIDLSGRPHAEIDLGLKRERLGAIACENLTHFFRTFAMTSRTTLHVELLRGENDHHRAEAAFKATALALRQALALRGDDEVPSTKGVL